MSTQRTGRKMAIQFLFQADTRSIHDSEKELNQFLETQPGSQNAKLFAQLLSRGTLFRQAEIDQLIQTHSKGWSLDRLNRVDKAILRLGFFELLSHTPSSIVINEAVELAKTFSSDESPKFINGILGGYAQQCLPASSNL